MSTSFYASKGNGYPKICFLCEYDAFLDDGHVTGHNLLTSISIAAALSIANIIEEIGGTIILIGCPGEYLGGTKSVMVKQGVFDDIDLVINPHPYTSTAESGTSKAIIPLKVSFIGNSGLSFLNKDKYTSLDGILLTFNILNSIIKGFPENVDIDWVLSKGGIAPSILPLESEAKFHIKSKEMDLALLAENKIREIVIYVSKLIHVQYSISLYEPFKEELISNKTLSRLFSHNLKENGIIEIDKPFNIDSGLSIGTISKVVPTIHPYISIIDESTTKFGTKEFSNATLSDFGFTQGIKAATALAFTALDIFSTPQLLSEIKLEFFNN